MPQASGADVAENRAGAAGKDGGQLRRVRRCRCVPKQVYAAVHRMQSAPLEAIVDRAGSQAETEELLAGHQAVLAGRERGH